MSKYLWYGIIEDVDTVRRIPVGRFWGVTLLITPITWLGPFVFFGLYFLLNLLNSQLSLADRLYQALLFTLTIPEEIFNRCNHLRCKGCQLGLWPTL